MNCRKESKTFYHSQRGKDGASSGASGVGSQEPSTQGSEVDDEEEDSTNSEEESELEALRLAALITKKENDPDRKVSPVFQC